jgi:hypothetical protein
MEKGIVPCPSIDKDTRWLGYSHTKEGWIFGYKLHLTSTIAIGELVIPLTAANVTTTANISDNKVCMYVPLTSSSYVFSLPSVLYTIDDPGHDAKKLYEHNKNTLGIDLICSVKRYKSTSKKRLDLACFYESEIGNLSTAREGYPSNPP